MSAGWRSVRPIGPSTKFVGRDVRGRPLKAAASVCEVVVDSSLGGGISRQSST